MTMGNAIAESNGACVFDLFLQLLSRLGFFDEQIMNGGEEPRAGRGRQRELEPEG